MSEGTAPKKLQGLRPQASSFYTHDTQGTERGKRHHLGDRRRPESLPRVDDGSHLRCLDLNVNTSEKSPILKIPKFRLQVGTVTEDKEDLAGDWAACRTSPNNKSPSSVEKQH